MPRANTSMGKILEAAGQEFSVRGYHLTSMDDIAQSAGVAKGTLYYNFPTKAALFKSVVAEGMEELMSAVRIAIDTPEPIRAQIERVIRLHLDTFAGHPHIVRIMFYEMSGGLDVEIREYVTDLRRRYESFFTELLDLGVAEGVVKDLDRQLLAGILIDMIYSASGYLVAHPSQTDGEAVYRLVEELLFRGAFKEGDR